MTATKGYVKVLERGSWTECRKGPCCRRSRKITYEAALFNGKEYSVQKCHDVLYDGWKNPDGVENPAMFLNTAANVSYYGALMKMALRP